jgi:hypothetical protein
MLESSRRKGTRSMTRFTYTLALAGSVLALAGCPGDDTSGGGTEGTGTDTGTAGDDGGMTAPMTMTTATPMTDGPVDTTDDPTTTPDDTTDGGGDCDPPCLPGQECIAGNCFGEPDTTGPLCEMWGESGSYGDCVAMGNAVCMGAPCVSDNPQAPTAGACAQLGCTDVCDCPDPAASGIEGGTLVCDTLTADMQNGCFFDCSGGAECPDGMNCLGGFFCAWGGAGGAGPYGDCVNPAPGGTMCEEGGCVSDNPMAPTAGVCIQPCMAAGDCPEAPAGATVQCADATGDMNNECFLSCGAAGGTCPDGMECLLNFICAWPVMEPVVPGFGDCVDPVPNDECLATETCFTDNAGDPTHGFCTSDCANVDECADAPATGDAPVACTDLGDGDTCILDCSGGETCPDDMVCIDNNYCAFEAQGTLLNEDFEGGMIPAAWTLIDNDGLTQDAMSPIPVDDAFVVVADPEGSQAAAGNSWYNPPAVADDWLITPQLSLGANSVLAWEARSLDMGMFADDYEVLVSTGGATIGEFMANATLLDVNAEPQTYTSHSVDLAAEGYANEDVYIAFHLNSDDGNILFIDNVSVTQ